MEYLYNFRGISMKLPWDIYKISIKYLWISPVSEKSRLEWRQSVFLYDEIDYY